MSGRGLHKYYIILVAQQDEIHKLMIKISSFKHHQLIGSFLLCGLVSIH